MWGSKCSLIRPEETDATLKRHRNSVEVHDEALLLVELAEIGNAPQEPWENAGTSTMVLGSRAVCRKVAFEWSSRLIRWKMQRLRHRELSGLTSSVGWVVWHGNGSATQDLDGLSIDKLRYPLRPTNKFMNIASRLSGQGHDIVWDAQEEGHPFPWPLPSKSCLVRVPSVFRRGGPVVRHLEPKEMANLLDLPLNLGAVIIEDIWMGSETGTVLSLKFHAELLLASVSWLEQLTQTLTSGSTTSESAEENTARTGLKRWLKMGQVVANHKLRDSSLAHMLYFAWVWDPDAVAKVSTATKANDAETNAELWKPGGDSPAWEGVRRLLRQAMLRWWRRRITREACLWLREQHGRKHDPEVMDCVKRAANAEWFEWADGSWLFFWRWPRRWIGEAKIGGKVFHLNKPPNRPRARRVPVETHVQEMIDSKVEKMLNRRYIRPVTSRQEMLVAIPHFAVAKGEDDIRVVWSDTENGVNPSIFVPSFFLPLPDTLFRQMPMGAYLGDLDIGEMFHNFSMHPLERKWAGVNLSPALEAKWPGVVLGCVWDRLLFGWRPSPYLSVRMLARGVEVAIGDISEETNPFHCSKVVLNLPGSEAYNPSLPWVVCYRKDGLQSVVVLFYVDDGRICAPTEELARRALRVLASKLQWLGLQDAARKRRDVSQEAGAWAGTVVFTSHGLDRKFISQSKWDKVREHLVWLRERIDDYQATGTLLPYRELLSVKGFLVYVAQTYTHLRPYLKGLHLTTSEWRPGRDDDGWATSDPSVYSGSSRLETDGEECTDVDSSTECLANDLGVSERDVVGVKPVPRLEWDIVVWSDFFGQDTPIMVLLRPVTSSIALAYGFVDASGEGFGGTWRRKPEATSGSNEGNDALILRRGFWCDQISEESSNYREFRNLVEHVRLMADTGEICGHEVWLFTDNAVTESAICNGSSTSKKLFDLVVQLKQLEIQGNFVLQTVHVAGT